MEKNSDIVKGLYAAFSKGNMPAAHSAAEKAAEEWARDIERGIERQEPAASRSRYAKRVSDQPRHRLARLPPTRHERC